MEVRGGKKIAFGQWIILDFVEILLSLEQKEKMRERQRSGNISKHTRQH